MNEASAGNPAVGAASDGRNIGFQAAARRGARQAAPTKRRGSLPPAAEGRAGHRSPAPVRLAAAELTWAERLSMLVWRSPFRRAISSIG